MIRIVSLKQVSKRLTKDIITVMSSQPRPDLLVTRLQNRKAIKRGVTIKKNTLVAKTCKALLSVVLKSKVIVKKY